MLEIGGIAHLHLVEVTFGKDILGSFASDGIAWCAIGIMHREEVVAVGVIEVIPVDLRHPRVAVLPCHDLVFIFKGAMGIGEVVTRQILVIVGTRVGCLSPLKTGLSSRTAKEIKRRME